MAGSWAWLRIDGGSSPASSSVHRTTLRNSLSTGMSEGHFVFFHPSLARRSQADADKRVGTLAYLTVICNHFGLHSDSFSFSETVLPHPLKRVRWRRAGHHVVRLSLRCHCVAFFLSFSCTHLHALMSRRYRVLSCVCMRKASAQQAARIRSADDWHSRPRRKRSLSALPTDCTASRGYLELLSCRRSSR